MPKGDIRKTQTARIDGLSLKNQKERVTMIVQNFEVRNIRNHFESQYGECNWDSKIVWNRIINIAGDSFLAMNDEEVQQFYNTKVINDKMKNSTIMGYYYSYKRIVRYLRENGYMRNMKADYRKNKRQSSLFDKPINEDGKREAIIADKLFVKKCQLKESINSIEQEIKKYEQQLKGLKEQMEQNRDKLARLENLQGELITELLS